MSLGANRTTGGSQNLASSRAGAPGTNSNINRPSVVSRLDTKPTVGNYERSSVANYGDKGKTS